MFLWGTDGNYKQIPPLHASPHDSLNLWADSSDGVHGGVLCKCEGGVFQENRKIALSTSQLLFQSSNPSLPL